MQWKQHTNDVPLFQNLLRLSIKLKAYTSGACLSGCMQGLFPDTRNHPVAGAPGHMGEAGGCQGPKRSIRKEEGSLQGSCCGRPPMQGAVHAVGASSVGCTWRVETRAVLLTHTGVWQNCTEEFILVGIGSKWQKRVVQENFGEEQQVTYSQGAS